MNRRTATGLIVAALVLMAPTTAAATTAAAAADSAAISIAGPLPRITFVAAPESSILVHGEYPKVHSRCKHRSQPFLHARFSGTIEVGKDQAGHLFVIGVLPVEQYLRGLAEVPPTWPMEALKAQAVAARTYALANLRDPDVSGRALGYQLCATDACQVYRGLGVANGPNGDRWRKAVEETGRQALLYRGRPADTFYFSTSNGHTYDNSAVFGGSPLPYLRPVRERDDGNSPVSHWRTSLPLADVARFLRAAGDWPAGTPVASVKRSGGHGVVVRGGGTAATLDASSFADAMNAWAPCLDPSRYPTANAYPGPHTFGTSLPQTVPSNWFAATTRGGRVMVTGRGWGHGVGMVQWGAEGKAGRGMSYSSILSFYYGGLRPTAVKEPAVIRVGIATGLTSVRLAGMGTVTARGTNADGPWMVTGGRLLRVRHASPPPVLLPAGSISAPAHTEAGTPLEVTVHAARLEIVRLVLRTAAPAARTIAVGPPRTIAAGKGTLTVTVPANAAGRATVRAVVTDGIDTVSTLAQTIDIRSEGPTAASSPGASGPGSGSNQTRLAIAVSVAALILAGAAIVAAARRRAHSTRP